MSLSPKLRHRCGVALLALIAVAAPALAEPPRPVEVSGHVGAFRFAGDESWGGTSAGYGVTGTIPFLQRWAFETDTFWATEEDFDSAGIGVRERRLMSLMHVVYRRGTERMYWFVGGGPGYQNRQRRGRVELFGPPDTMIGIREFESSSNDVSWVGYRTGVVVNPASHLVIRGEVVLQHFYVLPNTVVRVGVGWRF